MDSDPYSNTVICTLAVGGWAVTFGTAMRGRSPPRPIIAVPSTTSISTSYYSMWHCKELIKIRILYCSGTVLLLGSPLTLSVVDGSSVMSIKCPTEPAPVDCVNYVAVDKSRQNEHINLSQCHVKVTGEWPNCPSNWPVGCASHCLSIRPRSLYILHLSYSTVHALIQVVFPFLSLKLCPRNYKKTHIL